MVPYHNDQFVIKHTPFSFEDKNMGIFIIILLQQEQKFINWPILTRGVVLKFKKVLFKKNQ